MALAARLAAALPTRERLAENRWLRPFADRLLAPALWRFNRRSVPRGVALGLGIGTLLPFAHMLVAAVLALPARANVAVAMAVTWVNNPLTLPPIWWAAYHIGAWLLGRGAPVRPRVGDPAVVAHVGWTQWLVSDVGPATALGLVLLAALFALVGYAATALGWRWRTGRRWRRRARGRD
jgi:uncharacterized protein